jgi:hypothetical protein
MLPRSLEYDGGPWRFDVDVPHEETEGWFFDSGTSRTALPYGFTLGPDDAYGIYLYSWVATHRSVEAYLESLAVERLAEQLATSVTLLRGSEVGDLDLEGAVPLPETGGVADRWLRRGRELVSLHTGEALAFDRPGYLRARVYLLPEAEVGRFVEEPAQPS